MRRKATVKVADEHQAGVWIRDGVRMTKAEWMKGREKENSKSKVRHFTTAEFQALKDKEFGETVNMANNS